jgi:hypothetical protein
MNMLTGVSFTAAELRLMRSNSIEVDHAAAIEMYAAELNHRLEFAEQCRSDREEEEEEDRRANLVVCPHCGLKL